METSNLSYAGGTLRNFVSSQKVINLKVAWIIFITNLAACKQYLLGRKSHTSTLISKEIAVKQLSEDLA